MIIQPGNELWAFEPRDLEADASSEPPAEQADLAPARAILEWARTYLSKSHPELGRSGPVCPYVPASLRSDLLYITVRRAVPACRGEVMADVARHRDWFLQLEPVSGSQAELKTILVVYPDIPADRVGELVDGAQDALKGQFVDSGLMIGQFHPTPPTPGGLWNAGFRPLRSPLPLLAIRSMVPSDLPFLVGDRSHLDSYLGRFESAIPPRCRELVDRALGARGVDPVPGSSVEPCSASLETLPDKERCYV